MDNAGGHGTKDTIASYTDELMRRYKVQIVWKEPRSPENNTLDLGWWMSFQSWVEKSHRFRWSNSDALAFTCYQAWETNDGTVGQKSWECCQHVLKIIIADQGDNASVDDYRGSLFTSAIEPRYLKEKALLQEADEWDEPESDEDEEQDEGSLDMSLDASENSWYELDDEE
jgi:hypothetical protein